MKLGKRVGRLVSDSVYFKVLDSVVIPINDPEWQSVRKSLRDSVRESIGDSVSILVGVSIRNSVNKRI